MSSLALLVLATTQTAPLAVEERVLLEVPAELAATAIRAAVSPSGDRAAAWLRIADDACLLYGRGFAAGAPDSVGASEARTWVSLPRFSPDGAHAAWSCGEARAKDRESWEMWLDGKRLKRWDWIGEFAFSARGELAYQAGVGVERDPAAGAPRPGDYFVMRGKKQSDDYTGFGAGAPLWSPDGKRLAFLAQRPNGYVAVIDGKEHGPYPWVQGLCWSEDGQQIAWTALQEGGSSRILVGKEEFGAEREAVGAPALGGGALAYVYAARDRRGLVFAGEVVPGLYDDLGTPAVSADGKRVAVAAARGRKLSEAGWILLDPAWMDGADLTEAEAPLDGAPADSGASGAPLPADPGGGALGYLGGALGGGAPASVPGSSASFLVVDGRRLGAEWERVVRPFFSPDGRRVAARVHAADGWRMQLDDRATPAYDEVLVPRFAADGALEFGARRGRTLLFVRVPPAP